MIINNCLNILCELSEIEKSISEIEKLMQEHGVKVDSENQMNTLIQLYLSSYKPLSKNLNN